MNVYMGIDIGSTTSKGILLSEDKKIITTYLVHAGTGTYGPMEVKKNLLAQANLEEEAIRYSVVTGYGRKTYEGADLQMSELSCHAKGTHYLFPEARTVIDIGGQDAKVIRIDDRGLMTDFVMNDKCAAGTGRFLEVMATVLKIDIDDMEELAKQCEAPAKISSTCTVFAESEVISQLANGTTLPDLVAGICQSVAGRISSQAKRLGVEERVCMSGGVARNGAVRSAMAKELKTEILFSEYAQLSGAIGAALYAMEKGKKEIA